MSPLWMAYRVIAPWLGALAPAARVFASPEERLLWQERLGDVPEAGPVDAWLHGASMGEALAVAPLARELSALQRDARFHLTATTRGGRSRLAQLAHPASLAPIDAPQAVGRFFARIQPRRLFIVETEVWPHWLLRARDQRVPVAFVSARLSQRSTHRYQRLGGGLRSLIEGLAGVLCQTERDREHWLALGAPRERTAVVGNLKADALPAPAADRGAARAALRLDRDRPLLVLGNLRPGEPARVWRAWAALPRAVRETWQVVAVPRHPRAAAELRAEALRAGALVADGGPPRDGAWCWDDRLGVLASFYAVSDVAVVGGTFGSYGGHNPLEPAACGAAVLVGPHYHAQAEAVARLLARRAIRVARNDEELRAALAELLATPDLRAGMAAGALETVQAVRGAARRAVARLVEWRLWPAD
ncbi:MAG TPA: glycosyltransferase N-terminal domain-containing protein [Candidatus Limnocylindria bacterium]|nr:glycosyltransferase N-terminal domain-containing protein [Candidatus Limnocylindria bacterium]